LPEAAVSNEFGGLLRDLVRARTLLEGGVSAGTVPSVQAIELVRELGSTRARLGAVFAGLVGETSGQSVEALPEAELTEG
jgi:hypothetical protein